MAFDESLAARIREALERTKGVEEKKMFGCICFFIDGNALAGVWKNSLIARLGPVAKVEIIDAKGNGTGETVIEKMFNNIAPRFKGREGGYTRIMKLSKRRLGDAGETAMIELLKEGEVKVRATPEKEKVAAPAPTPVVVAPAPSPPPVVE